MGHPNTELEDEEEPAKDPEKEGPVKRECSVLEAKFKHRRY